MNAKHTPTPWVKLTHQDVVVIEGADGVRVARSSWHSTIRDPHPLEAEAFANFDLILLAVNSHDELVAALKEAKTLADTMARLTACRSDDEWVWGVQEKINAALSRIPDIQIKGAA